MHHLWALSVMVHSQVLQLDTELEAYTRRRAAFMMAIAAYSAWYVEQALFKQAYHTSILSGQMWVRELLGGNPQCIKDQLGMAKHVFRQLTPHGPVQPTPAMLALMSRWPFSFTTW